MTEQMQDQDFLIVPLDELSKGPPGPIGPRGEPFNVDKIGESLADRDQYDDDEDVRSFVADDTAYLYIKNSETDEWGTGIPFRGLDGQSLDISFEGDEMVVYREDGEEIARKNVKGPPGEGEPGPPGPSGYEEWLSQENTGTYEDYLEAQRGEPGISITAEFEGDELVVRRSQDSAEIARRNVKGEPGEGDPGLSAFEVWKGATSQPDATAEDYLAAQRGEPGKDGQSFTADATGDTAGRGEWDGQPAGFTYRDIGENPPVFYVKKSETEGDWSEGFSVRGESITAAIEGYELVVSTEGGEEIARANVRGASGARGLPGQGIPSGGSSGQFVRKKSASEYDTEFFTPDSSSFGHKSSVYDPNVIPLRTVRARLSDFISAKDYATGDGVTNDYAALQYIIAPGGVSTQRTIEIPATGPGYLVDGQGSPILIPSNTRIVGGGRGARLVRRDKKHSYIMLRNASFGPGNENISLENLVIEGDWNTGVEPRKTAKAWSSGMPVATGDLVKPSGTAPTNASGRRVYRVETIGGSTAQGTTGVTGATEPDWPTNLAAHSSSYNAHDSELNALRPSSGTDNGIRYREYQPATEHFSIYFDGAEMRDVSLSNVRIEDWYGVGFRLHAMRAMRGERLTCDWVARGGLVFEDFADDIALSMIRMTNVGDDAIAFTGSEAPAKNIQLANYVTSHRVDAEYGQGLALRAVQNLQGVNGRVISPKNAGMRVSFEGVVPTTDVSLAGVEIRNAGVEAVEVYAENASEIDLKGLRIISPASHGIYVHPRSGASADLGRMSFEGFIRNAGGDGVRINGSGVITRPKFDLDIIAQSGSTVNFTLPVRQESVPTRTVGRAVDRIVLTAPSGGFVWTNMPSAATEFLGVSLYQMAADLAGMSEIRMSARVITAGAASAVLRLQHSPTGANPWAGVTPTGNLDLPLAATGFIKTSWLAVNNAAKLDTVLRLIGLSGDGAADPVVGTIVIEVR